MTRRLRISFARPEDFRGEFDRNIAKGGVFIAGVGDLELREVVEVEIALDFIGERRTFAAEIVHVSEGGASPSSFCVLRASYAPSLPRLWRPRSTSPRTSGGVRRVRGYGFRRFSTATARASRASRGICRRPAP